MKVSEYTYHLPQALIAQYPAAKRDQSKLMVLDKNNKTITHKLFRDIVSYFQPGDCLILNNSKVYPARLFMTKDSGAKLEIFLLEEKESTIWEVLIKPGRRAQVGSILYWGNNGFRGKVIKSTQEGKKYIQINYNRREFMELVEKHGHIPLPPYIKREDNKMDRRRYQTVFAHSSGSVAAPTAGLHFSKALLKRLEQKGVQIGFVTLHVGLGTFKPVTSKQVEDHVLDEEAYTISQKLLDQIQKTKKEGKHVWAVGTTTTRVLETVADQKKWTPHAGRTAKFIYPPYKFRIIDRLITNFHLPQSTLLMLVAAFGGKKYIMQAYEKAVRQHYRFYSYGDAMLII